MIGIMHDAPGMGLVAPQLCMTEHMLGYDVDDDSRVIANTEAEAVSDEGCLSVPGVSLPVERSLRIHVTGRDVGGREVDFVAEELEARVIQHELDHLDGVLIVDRTTREARAEAMRVLREDASLSVTGGGL
jgi:peptide deformylase